MISEDTVAHVAQLARLALTPEETEQYTADLGKILHLVDELSELNLSDNTDNLGMAIPTTFRADVPTPVEQRFSREALMVNAPQEEHGFFRVPKILDEGN